MSFFIEGGWGMWPILVLGMVTVGAAARYARRPRESQTRLLKALGLSTLAMTVLAVSTDVAAVMQSVSDPARVAEADINRALMTGLMESTRPATLAGTLLAIACLLVTVGIVRARRGQAAA